MDGNRKNVDASGGALDPGSLAARTDSGAPRDGRRAMFVRGLATAPLFITLASRSALAASTACTISGMTSGIGSNHLAPSIGGCGSPPSCWATRVADWRGGFFQSTSFIATFMNGVSSQMSYPASSDSFDSCLAGTPTGIVVEYPGRKVTSPPQLAAQCVAAALNAALFGSDNTANGGADYYNHGSAYDVVTYINSWLIAASQGKTSPTGSIAPSPVGKGNNANTCMSTLTTTLTAWNSQGGAC